MTDGINLGIDGLGPATLLDRGGSAYVYLAEQLAFGRQVAVKVLFQALEDPDTFRRFERECRAIGAVSDHPNIVVVHGRGLTDDDRPYLVMEHRRGGSLADQLQKQGKFSELETIQIGAKIARALSVAHDAGVIHRDVKPANILLSAYGEPALADFGIARMDGASRTTAGIITASVNHASREVLSGDDATIQSDIYSLGSTLFTLATGQPPFVDPSDDSMWTLINRVVTTNPPDPEQHGVSEPLSSVLQAALTHDLSKRYQKASDLADALEDLERGGGMPTRRNANTLQFAVADKSRTPNQPLPMRSLPEAQPKTQSKTQPKTQSESAKSESVRASDSASHGSQPGTGKGKSSSTSPSSDPVKDSDPQRRPLVLAMLGAAGALVVIAAAALAFPSLTEGTDRVNNRTGSTNAEQPEDFQQLASSEATRDADATTTAPNAPSLDFPQAEIGPLVIDRRYALRVSGSTPGSQYQILLNDKPLTDFEDAVPVFFPKEPGRFRLTVNVETDGLTATSNEIDIYVSPGPAEPGYRVNLASVRSAPGNWPQALGQLDQLMAQGHADLHLSLSTRQEQQGLPYWNFYVGGFGENKADAVAYCSQRDLGPDQCFPALVPAVPSDS